MFARFKCNCKGRVALGGANVTLAWSESVGDGVNIDDDECNCNEADSCNPNDAGAQTFMRESQDRSGVSHPRDDAGDLVALLRSKQEHREDDRLHIPTDDDDVRRHHAGVRECRSLPIRYIADALMSDCRLTGSRISCCSPSDSERFQA